MGSDNMRVGFGQVEDLATRVNNGAESLDAVVGQLTAAFEESAGYWEGAARNTFDDEMKDWNRAWREMHNSLQNLQKLMREWVARARELDNAPTRG
jgi:WXG100 family type VII secretion target